jgi:subtilisin family serine protease
MSAIPASACLIPMLVAGALAFGPAHAAAPTQDGGYARGRILVEARSGLSDAGPDRILKEVGGKKRKIGQSRLHVVELPANDSEVDLKDRMVPGYNIYSGNTDLADICGHGTAVAGTAAATGNNATGVAGVAGAGAGAASIMALRIAYSDSAGCHVDFSTIANGITDAADHGARIANISYTASPAARPCRARRATWTARAAS